MEPRRRADVDHIAPLVMKVMAQCKKAGWSEQKTGIRIAGALIDAGLIQHKEEAKVVTINFDAEEMMSQAQQIIEREIRVSWTDNNPDMAISMLSLLIAKALLDDGMLIDRYGRDALASGLLMSKGQYNEYLELKHLRDQEDLG